MGDELLGFEETRPNSFYCLFCFSIFVVSCYSYVLFYRGVGREEAEVEFQRSNIFLGKLDAWTCVAVLGGDGLK